MCLVPLFLLTRPLLRLSNPSDYNLQHYFTDVGSQECQILEAIASLVVTFNVCHISDISPPHISRIIMSDKCQSHFSHISARGCSWIRHPLWGLLCHFMSSLDYFRFKYSLYNKFCSRRWGSSLPPSTWVEICQRTSLQSHLQTSPQALRSHTWSFGTLGQLLKIPPFVLPNKA